MRDNKNNNNKSEEGQNAETKVVVQKINNPGNSPYDIAYKYFSMISLLNDLGLVKRDLQLLAYSCSENKDISDIREEFAEKFKSSIATVGNIITKLYKRGIVVKEGERKGAIRVVPVLNLNFEVDLVLNINILLDKKEENNGD